MSYIPPSLIWVTFFGMIVAVIVGIMVGTTITSTIKFPKPPDSCGLLCVNYLAYGITLITTFFQLLGNTVVLFLSGSLIPFPFNMIIIVIIGAPVVLLLYMLIVALIP